MVSGCEVRREEGFCEVFEENHRMTAVAASMILTLREPIDACHLDFVLCKGAVYQYSRGGVQIGKAKVG